MIEALTSQGLCGLHLLALAEPNGDANLTAWALGGLVVVAMVADHITSIWERFRENPPAAQTYATKAELSEVHRRVDGMMTTISSSLGELKAKVDGQLAEVRKENGDITKSLSSIHRALGRLEGRTEGDGHHE